MPTGAPTPTNCDGRKDREFDSRERKMEKSIEACHGSAGCAPSVLTPIWGRRRGSSPYDPQGENCLRSIRLFPISPSPNWRHQPARRGAWRGDRSLTAKRGSKITTLGVDVGDGTWLTRAGARNTRRENKEEAECTRDHQRTACLDRSRKHRPRSSATRYALPLRAHPCHYICGSDCGDWWACSQDPARACGSTAGPDDVIHVVPRAF